MSPTRVARAKRLVRSIDASVARSVAQKALAAADGQGARSILEEYRKQLEEE